jgi:NADH-quinone oxidoreductase subunit J
MGDSFLAVVMFYLLAAVAVGGAMIVAFSRNIVHSAFSLLATFTGVAGLYALLSCDLVAVLQLLVYVGGVLILILFAVMLTSRIDEAKVSNRTMGLIPGTALLAIVTAAMLYLSATIFAGGETPGPAEPTAERIGNELLGRFVLPFEIVSVLLLAALLGGVTVARGSARTDSAGRTERE